MRMKDIFFPQPGQKVTEKYLRQVLVTSICSILLCMSCLVGTTWAWFTVSIEDAENVIHIAQEPPEVRVTVEESDIDFSARKLPAGTHTLLVAHPNEADDVQQKSILYVTFSVDEAVKGYVTLNQENNYMTSIQITTQQDCLVSWTVSWFTPGGVTPLDSNEIDLIVEDESEPTDETTEDPSASTEEETEPSSETIAPTQTTTDPSQTTTETTDPTQTTTETTDPTQTTTETMDPTQTTTETTAPIETTTETTQSTEAETEAPKETTQSAENEMESIDETIAPMEL